MNWDIALWSNDIRILIWAFDGDELAPGSRLTTLKSLKTIEPLLDTLERYHE